VALAAMKRVPGHEAILESISGFLRGGGAGVVEQVTSMNVYAAFASGGSRASITVSVSKFFPARISVTTQVQESEFTEDASLRRHLEFLQLLRTLQREVRGIAEVLVDRAEKGVL